MPPVPCWSTKTRSRVRRTSEKKRSIGPASPVADCPGPPARKTADRARGCRRRPGSRRSSGRWSFHRPPRGPRRRSASRSGPEPRRRPGDSLRDSSPVERPRTARPLSHPARPLRPAPEWPAASARISSAASCAAWSRKYTHFRWLQFARTAPCTGDEECRCGWHRGLDDALLPLVQEPVALEQAVREQMTMERSRAS